jgi:cytochrome b561
MNTLQTTTPKRPRLNSAFKRLMSIHWWMAGCYLILFCVGTLMINLPENSLQENFYDFHKSMGVLAMALLTWRILTLLQVSRKKYKRQRPGFSRRWVRNFILHSALYGFMWAVPIAGFLLSNSYSANNVYFFGLLLPDLFPENEAMVEVGRSLHFWLSYTFLAFIAAHILFQWKVVKANWRRFIGFTQKLNPRKSLGR